MTMNTAAKRLAIALVLIAFLVNFAPPTLNAAFSSSGGGKIDLYTEKQPYSGAGSNMPSDAFGPEEIVVLFALVTYNDVPVQNMLVAFDVRTPSGASFELAARTDSDGISTVNFTVQTPPVSVNGSEIFGEWFVMASVMIGNAVLQDTLSFKVDWIVKLISVRAINETLADQDRFGKEGEVGLEISLRSIAMTVRSADLSIVIQDENKVPVNFTVISDFQVQPNEKMVFFYSKLQIPNWAYVGQATVYVSAFVSPISEGGIPYCPSISTTFFITAFDPVEVHFDDVAVAYEVPSDTSVVLGQPVIVRVITQNEGTEPEIFNVTAYCDDVPIGTFRNVILQPYSHLTLNFTLDTSPFSIGNHTLTAFIPYLADEVDTTDNLFIDGLIEIKPQLPAAVHDIAIIDVEISSTSVFVGDLIQINVSVLNNGNQVETFTLTAYYNSSLIGSQQIDTLQPDAVIAIVFVLNTSLVPEGSYRISASAPLEADVNTSDNTFVDGLIEVMPRPSPFHDVAVLNVNPSSSLVYIGDTLDIYVVVKNLGGYVESFNAMVYANSTLVGLLDVENLAPATEKTLVFRWNTTDVPEGTYIISGLASSVLGEIDLSNNHYTDGAVRVETAPKRLLVPDWFYWALLALFLILIIMILLLWIYRRRKREEGSFYSGWAAWYYCYNLGRTRKI
jgi:hypothetical protein